MKSGDDAKRAAHAPSSGRGASSALDAMIRKRIPAPGHHAPSPTQAQSNSPEASSHKRRQ
jgi:hypothetical protein